MPRTAIERPVGVGFCTHNKGANKRCGRETGFKPDGVSRYSECPVHRERGMEKSRRRREAAGKVPRRRKSVIVSGHRLTAASASSSQDSRSHPQHHSHPYTGMENETAAGMGQTHGDGDDISHDQQRLPWDLHVLETASTHPLPTHSQAGATSALVGAIGQHLPPNGISDQDLQIHPQLRTQHQPIGPNMHRNTAINKQSQLALIPNPAGGLSQSIDGLHVPYSSTMANDNVDKADGSGNNDVALTSPPLAPLDFSPPRTTSGTHAIPPPHAHSSIAAPARMRTASEIETETRAAIWANHHTSLHELKESVDSLLATLWARDTDPRELEGMFEALSEEVKRTRERLIIG
ncbi:hypothetical protein QFC21_004076 [Naganishia friedmannii]|uniref:Uncharacterized protein n=1 Tax=Naganishia friedmannii TaxID=89922 RepID=A0ACC2VK77_9TREE|nr:hypothetical protein QFC21_004076 [Naganishia friedmannii]